MLARREPVTLRKLVAGTGISTMAVYTYFGDMSGLLGAIRQEGFVRLAHGLGALEAGPDPVADLAAAGATYAMTAERSPALYSLMFDGSIPLPAPSAADATLEHLTNTVGRCIDSGRFFASTDPGTLSRELWLLGHGACSLYATGVMTFAELAPTIRSGLAHLYAAAGDAPERARSSVRDGWQRIWADEDHG